MEAILNLGNLPYPSSFDDWESDDDKDFSQIPFHDFGSDSDSEQDSGDGFWDKSDSESGGSFDFLCCLNYIYLFMMLKLYVYFNFW